MLFLLLASVVAAGDAAKLPPAASGRVDFSQDVAPLLQKRCLSCHGAERPKAGLRLDTREHLLQGGNTGAVLAVGKSAESRLIHVLAGIAEDDIVMPPKGERLSPKEIGALRAWIDQGLPWPKEMVLTAPKSTTATHWAFLPPRKGPPPDVKRRDWGRNPIDAFILSRLEREGIAPAPEADRATLLRRVTLDLIGLPPTPEEVAAFVADSRPDAYERVVDRLLASPHYGERWARPWLDLCHYADSDGYLQDMLRPVAWRYRHWLVEALNRDLPYDQFTLQQIAGDLLPSASMELALATGFLRNTLSNREGGADLEEYRVEQIVDRTMTVSAVWLGLTVGCARCHDHKFDPISQREFFQLYAFLDSSDEINVYAPLSGEREHFEAKYAEYRRQRDELLKPLAKEIAELQGRWEKRVLQAAADPGKDAHWDRQWEVLGLVWGNHLGEGQLEACQFVRAGPAARTEDQRDRLLLYFLQNGSGIDGKRFTELKLAELAKKLEALRKEVPWPTRAPVMQQTPAPRPVRLHVRGDFRVPGIEVRPGTVAVLPVPGKYEATRLGLAKWLIHPDNPLPARVAVNRFWQEFFGRGLVPTSDDFGTRGEPPSHPELLDCLAISFRENGWSMKAIQRLIVTSATYRQSSKARPELAVRDPHNRLLTRQATLRLSAEQVRDASLAVSGLLVPRVGGPSVFPPQPDSVIKEGFDHKWEASQGADRYRRGIYTFLRRLAPFAQNVTFDAPGTTRICTRRERSNTPLQALTLLNDAVFVETAQALAGRVLREKRGVPERIDHLFALCLARPATAREKDRLHRYFDEQLAIVRREPASAAKLFPGKMDGVATDEAAAWVGVCSVMLNLHEFITRD